MRRIALCAALAIAALPAAQAPGAKPRMSPAVRADIPGKRLFDIGVADPDNDGWQDIFTTNHKFASVFLRNRHGRSFRNEIDELGLGPDSRFPGLELLRRPDMSSPGVYIWPTDDTGEAGRLHIASSGLTVSGKLTLVTKNVSIRSQTDAESTLGRDDTDRPIVDFTLQPGGDVVVSSNGLSDLPIRFDFPASGAGAVTPDQIKVGTHAVTPDGRSFQFKLRDRHGLAFADVAGDSDEDVFVATGGLGGGIASPRYLGYVQDMLMVSGSGPGGGYANQIFPSAIVKSTCRGRAVSYADADGGGELDLTTTCEGEHPKLWAQVGAGAFIEVPGPPVVGSAYRWAELGRGPPALLVTTGKGLEVWRTGGGLWDRVQIVRAGGDAGEIALGDYDNSGTLDVMLAGKQRLRLLRNRHGRLHPVRGNLGLPSKTAAASFIDYDNDGRLDVDLAPQGLYRWSRGRHRFVPTGALRQRRTGYAIVEWADFDNDGRRDPLIATSKREFSPRSKIVRRRNTSRSGHWLEVDLTGSAINREAIGASVRIDIGHGRRITQWVGQNDDSRHSQGHYRLYFGLGKARSARRLVVRWPEGRPTRMKHVHGDRLLKISQRR
jgi:ASPIC and UnbV/FG-GAP-like repeat